MTATSSRPLRLAWADMAKGMCILLVVLVHATGKHYAEIDWQTATTIPSAWNALNTALQPIRMPLFFLLSGFFAASAITRQWSQVITPRIARPYYLYAVWLVVHTVFFSFGPYLLVDRHETFAEMLSGFIFGTTNLWYLYALAAYFAIAKAASHWPSTVPMLLAGCLSAIVSVEWIMLPGNGNSVLRNLVFFLIGAYLPGLVRAIADAATVWRMMMFGLLYGVAGAMIIALDLRMVPGMEPALSVLAIIFGIIAAVVGARIPIVTRLMAFIGQRTLSIYVLHLPILAILHATVTRIPLDAAWRHPIVAAVYPAVVTAVLVLACLVTHAMLIRTGAGWMFQMPSRVRQFPAGEARLNPHSHR